MQNLKNLNVIIASLIFVSLLLACSDSSTATDGDIDLLDGDIDLLDADSDIFDTYENEAVDSDTEADTEQVEVEAECSNADAVCLLDGYTLSLCVDGKLQEINCWEQAVGICKDGACVANWIDKDAALSNCSNDPHADSHTLSEKAAHMDLLMENLHVHPSHGLVAPVTMKDNYYELWATANSKTVETMNADDYLAAEEAATYDNVKTWHPGENDGLFSSIYVVSQIFRYAATKDQQALDNIKMVLGGTYRQLQITGVPGIYTREYITPGIDGMACPENPCHYYPDISRDDKDKDDNRWVMVKDGCLHHFGGDSSSYTNDEVCTGEWVNEGICGLSEYNGYCWTDNVSKDEYSGHMMAAALAAKLVDDAEVQTMVTDIFDKVVNHFIENDMGFVDHDNLLCEHGQMWSWAGDGFPGFTATLVLSWIQAGMDVTGREDFRFFYEDCLLKESGPVACVDRIGESDSKSYLEFMEKSMLLYVGKNACVSNWNNSSMAFLSIMPLIWFETDIDRRLRYQAVLENHMIREDDNFRDLSRQKNAMYNFIYASMRNNESGLDSELINDAICSLQQFPISKADTDRTNTKEERPANPECIGRSNDPNDTMADTPQEIYQRCPQTNVWWNNPYRWDNCATNHFKIHPGSDYLMTYWMARYFEFIKAED